MCAVIDANCLNPMFTSTDAGHAELVPILNWITTGSGSMVYGGTKYKRELAGANREAIRMVNILRRGRRAIEVDERRVNEIELEVMARVNNARFDDQHLVAIVSVSGCRIICTDDARAMPYLQDRDLYQPYSVRPPKIYQYRSHAHLCCADNVVPQCRRVN